MHLNEPVAAKKVQPGGHDEGHAGKGAVLQEVAQGAAALMGQRDAEDPRTLPPVAQRLARAADTEDIDLVPVGQQRLDLAPNADVEGKPELPDDENARHGSQYGRRRLVFMSRILRGLLATGG